jgi:8-oxo-dGTP diphosphatase
MWESPGGKVEDGETHGEALGRELSEELGIHVTRVADFSLWEGEFVGPLRPFQLSFYRVLSYQGTPRGMEGQGLGWFEEEQVRALPLAPGNLRALHWLVQEAFR